MQTEEIELLIRQGLETELVRVRGDGRHFTAVVVSTHFAGKSRLNCQRLVFETVKEAMATERLHALTLKTYTPEEWQQLENQSE